MQITFKEISLDAGNIADNLKGLRFVHLSGLHIKKDTNISHIENLTQKINFLHVDFVFFTGGFVRTFDSDSKYIKLFKKLHAKKYFVGENSYSLKIKQDLAKADIQCLENRVSLLNINNEPLQIVGLGANSSSSSTDKKHTKELFAKLDENISTILLTNSAQDVKFTKDIRVDIQLSSEVQMKLPFQKPKKDSQFHLIGLYVYGRTLLYVSKYLGFLGTKNKTNLEVPIFIIE